MIKAIFLDRDGVINEDNGYTYKIDDLKLLDGVIQGLQALRNLDYEIIIITNQAGIARGFFSVNDFHIFMNHIINTLHKNKIQVLDYFFCPHHPEGKIESYAIKCNCRKPEIGMLEEAKEKYKIDFSKSIIIGDKESDILAGKNAGLLSDILISNYSLTQDSQASYIAKDLVEASNIVAKYLD